MSILADYWPPDGIRVRTRRLRLSVITESDFPEAIEAILAGIHDPRRMPFENPWTDAPRDELIPNSLRHWWSVRGNVTPEHWQLPFAVRHEDTFVGVQELAAKDFAVTRTVRSGSWLTRSAQGNGIGVEMLAVSGLGPCLRMLGTRPIDR